MHNSTLYDCAQHNTKSIAVMHSHTTQAHTCTQAIAHSYLTTATAEQIHIHHSYIWSHGYGQLFSKGTKIGKSCYDAPLRHLEFMMIFLFSFNLYLVSTDAKQNWRSKFCLLRPSYCIWGSARFRHYDDVWRHISTSSALNRVKVGEIDEESPCRIIRIFIFPFWSQEYRFPRTTATSTDSNMKTTLNKE